MICIMHHQKECAAHAKSLAAHLHRCDVRTPQAKFEGERTCRPAHASATCAYARDQNHELGAPCPLAQAVGATCARSSVTFILGVAPRRSLGTCEGVRSAACGPAHPVDGSRPRSRARRIYLHGESSGARAGLPIRSHAHAYARVPTTARGAHSVCDPSQVAICAPSGAKQTSLEVLAQLRAKI